MDKTDIKIALVSTFPPRQCGLATFSHSLTEIFEKYLSRQVRIIAVNDKWHDYPPRVVFKIEQDNRDSYIQAANFINASDIEIVVLQHEYGIFGGKNGEFILDFLQNINKPIVTSLHSVLKNHSRQRRDLTRQIINFSNSVIVMTKSAKKFLIDLFDISPGKIFVVKHGVPNIRFDEKNRAKKNLGLEDKITLATFGLLNRGKGIEVAIEALSRLSNDHPEFVYHIIGATHPSVLRQEGEKYRSYLQQMINKFRLKNKVFLVNSFLNYDDLVRYLMATDIYLCPQLDFNQSFSGTVSYALGCGCAVVSSPTEYAKEILADNRGILVEPKAEFLTPELKKLVAQPDYLQKINLKSYQYGRKMIWSLVGLKYLQVVESNLFVKNDGWIHRLPNFHEAPPLKYFQSLTTSFGICQHAKLTKHDKKFGYSLDDQARALLVCQFLWEEKIFKSKKTLVAYFNYLKKAVDQKGNIHNFFNWREEHIDENSSDDAIARSFWALANLKKSKDISFPINFECRRLLNIYQKKIKPNHIQTMAYTILGYSTLKQKEKVAVLADRLVSKFNQFSDDTWQWYDSKITWGNGVIVLSLVRAYELLRSKKYLRTALKSLKFLEKHSSEDGYPAPIGQKKWLVRGGKKSVFDQQPIEAADMVLLYNALFNLTGERKYKDRALSWFGWYFGNNVKQVMVFDSASEGVCDGITSRGLNQNQGAESIITFLLAFLSFKRKI